MTMQAAAVPTEPARKIYLDRLQWLRALAAFMVVFAHAQERLMISRGVDDPHLLDVCWQFGHVGVATFFAISGFIMCHTTRHVAGGAVEAGSFLRRRLIRILPMYYLATLTFLAAGIAVGEPKNLIEVLTSLLFFPWPNADGNLYPVVGVGWTLNYEMLFYVVFSVAVWLFSSARWLIVLLVLLAAVGTNLLFGHTMPVAVGFWTARYLLYFCVGIGVFALTDGPGRRWRLPTHPAVLFSALCALLIAVAVVNAGRYFHPLTFAAIALALLLSVVQADADLKVRTSPFAGFLFLLGEASYVSYLFHVLALAGLIKVLDHIAIDIRYAVPLLLASIAYALCTVLYLAVERPFLRLASRWNQPQKVVTRP